MFSNLLSTESAIVIKPAWMLMGLGVIGLTSHAASNSQSESTPATMSQTAAVPAQAAAQPPVLPQRMRGCNAETQATLRDPHAAMNLLVNWGANVLRINIHADKNGSAPTEKNPLTPYAEGLQLLDQMLPKLRVANIKVIVCAANIYGRNLDVMWKQTDRAQAIRDHLADFWEAFARRYKDEPAIIAYDVFNEPNYQEDQEKAWYEDMLPKAVAAIRKVNLTIWLVVEPGPWGLPQGFADMKPIDDPNVIYSFHHYAPHRYLHQGIHEYQDVRGKLTYPGLNKMFNDSPEFYWDKTALLKSMQPAIDFARKYHVRMLVGEFSVIRWAPGGAQWLADSINLFEQQGWDWCYHAVGAGWNGWNLTYGPDASEALTAADGGSTTDRLGVLLNSFTNNVIPAP